MSTGIVFDIKEFSINDGPGVRTTVFLKGCPLHCAWCHNPEGISSSPQLNKITNCFVGKEMTARSLANLILNYKDIYDISGGGATFSGGEPTFQKTFLLETLEYLKDVHVLLDTSGLCDSRVFQEIVKKVNHVYFDLKLSDENEHIKWTGKSNVNVLENLRRLNSDNCPYTIRIPMIPYITDSRENLNGLINIICMTCKKGTEIHCLPYNKMAQGKYTTYDMKYELARWYRKNNVQIINDFCKKLRLQGYKTKNFVGV